ncbi:MAG: galactose oxidase [Verrucomicrobiia bacterium]|jgi:N-acetylneuraminic acid mutarotase
MIGSKQSPLPRNARRLALTLVAFAAASTFAQHTQIMTASFSWNQLPPIPDREGFAGSFAGVSGGALIVAGGANFPDKRPWEGGAKLWCDSVFVLEKPDGAWKLAGKLPRPLGYGIAVTAKDGIVCIGGSSAQGHHADVFLLNWRDGKLATTPLPPLPQPCANMSGALVGNTLYVAGGIAAPDATTALKTFWALDLDNAKAVWREMEPWPGRERMLATAGACDGSFFLFSGTALHAGPDGKPVREWLRDAYRYTPGAGWKRIADLPRVSVAAPSPALNLLVIGGDDGAQVNTLPTAHKGFPRDVLAYDSKADTWRVVGEVPFSLVTTAAVEWNGCTVIPGGEARPGVRSPEVWTFGPTRPH